MNKNQPNPLITSPSRLPLSRKQIRENFRRYIWEGRHMSAPKSYREIARDFSVSHGTVMNWMREDFPDIATTMQGTNTWRKYVSD